MLSATASRTTIAILPVDVGIFACIFRGAITVDASASCRHCASPSLSFGFCAYPGHRHSRCALSAHARPMHAFISGEEC